MNFSARILIAMPKMVNESNEHMLMATLMMPAQDYVQMLLQK